MVQVVPEVEARTEDRDGMRITWHQPIPMDDGSVLRADVFRPIEDGNYPVILTYGVYAKGLSYQEGYSHQWNKMVEDYPEILEGSTNKYQNWEVTDPDLPPIVVPLATRFLEPWTTGEAERSPEAMVLSSRVLGVCSPVSCAA